MRKVLDRYPYVVYIEYRKGVYVMTEETKAADGEHVDGGCCAAHGCSSCIKHKHRDKESKEYKSLISRLRRIEGQVRGVSKMVEDDRYCVDILTQVSAIQCALNGFTKELLAQHIKTCVVDDIRAGKTEVVDELVATLQKVMK